MSSQRGLPLVISALLLAAPAFSADPPPAAPSPAPAAPSAAPALPGSARRPLAEPRERFLERLRDRGLTLPSASSALPFAAPSGVPLGSARPAASSGTLLAEELTRKWRELTATRLERRERHR